MDKFVTNGELIDIVKQLYCAEDGDLVKAARAELFSRVLEKDVS